MQGSLALADLLSLLQAQASACRSQAIRLNAKLTLLERQYGELRGVRERLAASSARLDHAVDDLVRSARRR